MSTSLAFMRTPPRETTASEPPRFRAVSSPTRRALGHDPCRLFRHRRRRISSSWQPLLTVGRPPLPRSDPFQPHTLLTVLSHILFRALRCLQQFCFQSRPVFFHVAPSSASSPSLVNLIEHEIALARRKRRVLKRALGFLSLPLATPRHPYRCCRYHLRCSRL